MTEEKKTQEAEPVAEQKPEEAKVTEATESAKGVDQGESTTEDKKEIEVPAKFKSIVSEIEKMSVLDLAELVKILEDKFGVSAAAPVIAAGPTANGGGEPAEEKTEFNVELTGVGDNKIAVIKAVRSVTDLGLKEAKDLVDSAPKVVKESVKKEEAEKIKKQLEEAGAQVILK